MVMDGRDENRPSHAFIQYIDCEWYRIPITSGMMPSAGIAHKNVFEKQEFTNSRLFVIARLFVKLFARISNDILL